MLAACLHSVGWHRPDLILQIDFGPPPAQNLAGSSGRQDARLQGEYGGGLALNFSGFSAATAPISACSSFRASNPATSAAGRGGENTYPWIWSQPSSRSLSTCTVLSTPSAIVDMPSPWASVTIARTISILPFCVATSSMNDLSILILSKGNRRR